MAITDLQKFTVKEKLNKMDVDIISVDVAVQSSQSLDLMYEPTEIPNAVAVPGGTCIIQSITASLPLDKNITHNLVISDVVTSMGVSKDSPLSNVDNAVIAGIQGFIPISVGTAFGSADTVASVLSIGLICKAASDTTSLFVYGIQTASNSITGTMNLKFGIVKD